jgi:hypothetical protein
MMPMTASRKTTAHAHNKQEKIIITSPTADRRRAITPSMITVGIANV